MAAFAVKYGDGQAPVALAGDAPVGPLPDHALHAALAPFRQPFDLVGRRHRRLLEGVHGAEPLVGGPVEDGVLAAPAVGVLVEDLLGAQQGAAGLQVLEDDLVGLVRGETLVFARQLVHPSPVVHRHQDADLGFPGGVVLPADLIVVLAVARRGMDAAGAGVQGHVVAAEQHAGPVVQGVLCRHQLEVGALPGLQHLQLRQAAGLLHALFQLLRQDIDLPVVGVAGDHIVQGSVDADGQVARQGPGGGGPDHEEDVFVFVQLAPGIQHGEFHEDGAAGVLGVFDLRLRQGRLVLGAPVDGLLSFINIALLIHPAEDLHFLRLELGVHGAVGVIPVGQHAQALELGHLNVHVVLGELVAGVPEFGDGHLLAVQLLLLDDGGFDGHAVVVPAGGIAHVPARHGFVAVDEVLQAFVQGGAHMDLAVGEGGAVVEDEAGLAFAALLETAVNVLFLPALQPAGLPLAEARLHGKVGLGHVQRRLVILRHL